MATINEIKEQRVVVKSVGDFADSLQQIAAGRMVKLRKMVMASRRFVDEATIVLRELELERTKKLERDLGTSKSALSASIAPASNLDEPIQTAIIVITSDQGLCGSYNSEIFKRVDTVIAQYPGADYFVLGKKGQEYFTRLNKTRKLHYYPYSVPEHVNIEHLKPLISMFYHYDQIYLIYSKYINTVTRDVVFMELSVPHIAVEELQKEHEEGAYIFEPSVEDLISGVSANLRFALFRQQFLDSKLSLYTSQMVAMQTASDNALDLLKELKLQYNKARRKLIDKKIQEVQAGRALWANE